MPDNAIHMAQPRNRRQVAPRTTPRGRTSQYEKKLKLFDILSPFRYDCFGGGAAHSSCRLFQVEDHHPPLKAGHSERSHRNVNDSRVLLHHL